MTAYDPEADGDLTAIQADDALLDALGGTDPAIADGLGDQELNALLLAWRRDIDSEPLAELVDVDTAVTTVKTASLARKHSGRGRRRRYLVPIAAACAAAAIAFTGTGLAARDAQPGDTLWGLTKVLYSDHARSVEAAATAKLDLEKANLALADNRLADARKALDDAQAALNQVTDDENRDQLLEQHRQLAAQLGDPAAPPAGQSTSNNPTTPPPVNNPANTASQQSSGQPTSLPGTGSTSQPDTTSVTQPPPPPPPDTTTSSPPPVTTPTDATGNDPGSGGGSPRNESSESGGTGVGGQNIAPENP
ncbi:anti-sigma-D factor RsdA [Amycolatopsis rhabdoformis]|uniref:Anti-sigma-D factor RsdA n=2 Tax=Amycolatopsis rhabdoformis TaxID=1448059 RepID=A0ABZ1INW8_9PSEU|nr:anti-sigma-D factor RsdA [Amycolatopsis rhabdoformis]WSE35381.1 anti-sigma-D factor RsdA [Amycolatopsis rhabdoformis]